MNRAEILEKLNTLYLQRKQESVSKNKARIAEVSQHKELEEAIVDRHATIMLGIRSAVSNTLDPKIDLKSAMQEKNEKIHQLLIKYGYPSDYLEPIYHCSICKDEGKIFSPSTKECSCFVEEYNKLLASESGFSQVEQQSFSAYNPYVYSDTPIVGKNYSQRTYMNSVLELLKLYAEEFPDNKKTTKNLLFYGKSGLGKTFMMRAIHQELVNKNKIVHFTSAYKWFELAKKSYFGLESLAYEELLNADMLMIDDLGTEPLQENITVPQLFNVINERHSRGLHTILSTNLDLPSFSQRYTERVTSRLEDKRFATIIPFVGEDVRKKMGK